jgi:hypothetical protein
MTEEALPMFKAMLRWLFVIIVVTAGAAAFAWWLVCHHEAMGLLK